MAQRIPVYLINLDRRPDRRSFMEDQLAAMGVTWERVAAVDAASVTDSELAASVDVAAPLIRMGRGSQACAATTIALFRRIAGGEARAAVLVQDDCELSRDLAAFVADADWIPPDIGLVQFEKWSRRPTVKLLGPPLGQAPVPGRSIRRLHSRTGGAGCFLVTREAAAAIASRAVPLRFPIDHLLFNLNLSPLARELGVAMVVPALARQAWDRFSSDIAPTTKAQQKTWRARLRRGWYEVNLLPRQTAAVVFGRARMRPIVFAACTAGGGA